MGKRVLVAMSGGVDSGVAAKLLIDKGYDCAGASMRLFDGGESTCCSLDDVEDARAVCRTLGIPHHVFNFKDEFRDTVLARFVSIYENGGTPNPCIDCNRYLKFEKFLHRAAELEYDYIATGHYARTERAGGRTLLRKAADTRKDQGYVLAGMTQEQLGRTLFPLGEYLKPQVRDIAERHGLVNARKADSQDLCFAPGNDYAAALTGLSGRQYPPGDFVDTQGRVLGRHGGIIRYTVGQRKGLGISCPGHLYVLEKRAADNTIVLGERDKLLRSSLTARDFNWISFDTPPEFFRAAARIRYNSPEVPASVTILPDADVRIDFDEPTGAIAPGQLVVLYDGEYVVGGGTILG